MSNHVTWCRHFFTFFFPFPDPSRSIQIHPDLSKGGDCSSRSRWCGPHHHWRLCASEGPPAMDHRPIPSWSLENSYDCLKKITCGCGRKKYVRQFGRTDYPSRCWLETQSQDAHGKSWEHAQLSTYEPSGFAHIEASHQRNLNSEFVMLWIIALVHDENRDTLQYFFTVRMAWSKVSIHSLLSLPLEKASTWLLCQLTRGPMGMGDGPGRQRTLWSRFGWYLDQSCQGLSGFGAQSRQCRWTCWFSVANWRASYQPMNAATK